MALDVPREAHPEDADYSTLLAPGNATDVPQRNRAIELIVPPDVLGVEMDGDCIPFDVRNSITEGDRAAFFGRWINDTGHFAPAPDGSGDPDPGFRTEIHPPLLMACAHVQPNAKPDGLDVTRAVFTSRPYLVGQTFGDPGTIYEDGVDDDGALLPHMYNEVRDATLNLSVKVEAHCKIKSRPFLGAHQMHIIVRPPAPPAAADVAAAQVPPAAELQGHPSALEFQAIPPPRPDPALTLSISFNFTIRNGCLMQVSTDGDAVHVNISLDDTTYTPPPLPQRNEQYLTQADIVALEPEVGPSLDKVNWVERLTVLLGSLGYGSVQGITIDRYVAPNDAAFRQDGAVLDVSPGTLPQDRGITINDAQPYPLTGWLEVGWQVVQPTNKPTDDPPAHKGPKPPFHWPLPPQ